jgi:hypothetical protein
MLIGLLKLMRKHWEIHYYLDEGMRHLKNGGYIYRATYKGKRIPYAWAETIQELLIGIAYFEYQKKKGLLITYKRNDFFRCKDDIIKKLRIKRTADRRKYMQTRIPTKAVNVWPKP